MNINYPQALKIGDLTAKLPIVQGGMSVGISLSRLASAVANEGGIGVIGTAGIGMLEPDIAKNFLEANIRALRKEIRKAKALTPGILGVNVMVALTNFADMVRTAIEEQIDVIFSGAGLPMNLPEFLTPGSKTKLVPIVSSARVVRLITKRWIKRYNYVPDAFVIEGPLAGGHLGFKPEQIEDPKYGLEELVPEIVQEVKAIEQYHDKTIPIIAGGGIYTGKDMYDILRLGASAVQMATRFVTTHECDAATEFKQAYIDSKKTDGRIIKSPVGLPGRAIKNQFLEDVEAGKRKPYNCPYHCIITCDYKNSPYCIANALINAAKGNLEQGFAFAGANAYLAEKIISVKEVIQTLLSEYECAVRQLAPQACVTTT